MIDLGSLIAKLLGVSRMSAAGAFKLPVHNQCANIKARRTYSPTRLYELL